MQKFVNTETKNSLTSFEQFGHPPQYWTVEKNNTNNRMITEQGSNEEFDTNRGSEQPMSNFSNQYRQFKSNGQINNRKSQERRNINLSKA